MTVDKHTQARRELEALKDEILEKKRMATDTTYSAVVGEGGHKPFTFDLKPRQVLRGHYSKVYAMQWSKDSSRIVSASQDGKLVVWHAITGLKTTAIPLRSSWMMTCAYSPCGEMVACGGLDNICTVYEVRDGESTQEKPMQELTGHTGYVSCCQFQSSSKILTSSGDMFSHLWDINTGDIISKFEGHGSDVLSLTVHPTNPALFLSSSCDGTVRLWDTRRDYSQRTFLASDPKAENRDVNCVSFHSSGHAFASGADEGTCRVFDIRSYSELTGFNTNTPSPVCAESFSKSGRFLFTGYDNSICIVWDMLCGGIAAQLHGHDSRISCTGVSPNGLAVCTGSWDSLLKVWA